MAPIVSTLSNNMSLSAVAPPAGQGMIPLSTIIDYIVQRTYHEITVLAELLPKKSDMERKIDIVQFASRTRQLFIRLLALVKWANSASKVDKCAAISTFLDRQSLYFVDSADMFAKMARETLVHGRLPNFSLPCAIDVLTTGSYPRLPSCIRDRIVPPDLITPAEKQHTLTRLSQIIQHRLVTHPLPAQLHNLKIENGRVKFHVEHEFTATLTLMGDSTSIPWRLLDIDILVEDPELGDGKALVHSLQVHYIHQLVQARLLENDKPLHDLYNCLHSFCQSLQLEVLFSQAERLLRDRYGDCVKIEEYLPGRSLILSYWRDAGKQFTVQVHSDKQDHNKPLQVTHVPALNDKDSARAGQAIKSDHLSVEKLLAQTIQVRSEGKLASVEADLKPYIKGHCELRDVPSVLYVPVLQPLVPTEMLRVSVDILRGQYLVSIAQYRDCPVAQVIEKNLNEKRSLEPLLVELRIWLALRRCEKSVQYLPACVSETLPISNPSCLDRLEKSRLYIRIGGQSHYYLIVEAKCAEFGEVNFDYYMLSTTPEPESSLLRAGLLMKLDRFTSTHGQGSKICETTSTSNNARKRKLFSNQTSGSKQMKFTSEFVPELTHIYAVCEERIPYVLLTSELQRRGFSHQGIHVDGQVCMSLGVISFPDLPGPSARTKEFMKKNLISCTFRLQRKPVRLWLVELVFDSMVVQSQSPRESGPVHRAHLQYELHDHQRVVSDFLEDWLAIAMIFQLVLDYEGKVLSYSFKRLSLVYGPDKKHCVSVNWKAGLYHLVFSMLGNVDSANCHSAMAVQINEEFNRHRSVTALLERLEAGVVPLSALHKLTSIPTPGLALSDSKAKLNQAVSNFTLIPVTSWHARLVYRNTYCLDIQCAANSVCIRDGAYSLYDSSKVMAGYSPVQSLKTFLEMYSDDQVLYRRKSTNEADDNPPSPVGLETAETTFMPHQYMGSPARRFPPPSPMTPSSNPHTPASPAARPFVNSPAAAFQLASPPSISSVVPSPGMGAPSPGILPINSPAGNQIPVSGSPGFVPTPSPASLSHLPSPATGFLNPGSQEPPSPFGRFPASPGLVPPSPRHSIMSPATPSMMMKDQTEFAKPHSQFPSRVLPASQSSRTWAASIPTHLSHASLLKIVRPVGSLEHRGGPALAPLEQFLGSVYLRRQVQKNLQTEDGVTQVSPEVGMVHYKTENVRLKCFLNPQTLLTLQIQIQQDYEHQWSAEDTKVMEEYFEHKIAAHPFKPNAVTAFNRLLTLPVHILRDFIRLLRLELTPDLNLNWRIEWCSTFSPASLLGAAPGTPAVFIKGSRLLFLFQLTRNGEEQQSLIFPFLYDTNSSQVTVAETKQNAVQHQMSVTVNQILKRTYEYNMAKMQQADAPLSTSIREVMANFMP